MCAPVGLEIQDAVSAEGQHTLILTGELHLGTVPELGAVLDELQEPTTGVTLDLSGLTFMDTSGLHAVLGADNLCHQKGYVFSLICGNETIHGLFEAAGLADDLPFQSG